MNKYKNKITLNQYYQKNQTKNLMINMKKKDLPVGKS